jgi:hypothetical protein
MKKLHLFFVLVMTISFLHADAQQKKKNAMLARCMLLLFIC